MVTEGEAQRHRRAFRGVQGAARRLLPARVQGSRRGARLGPEDPAAGRRGRGAAGDGLRGAGAAARPLAASARRDGRLRSARRPPVPARVGAGGRHLIRVLGDFDLAEEAVQEAFVVALERWPRRRHSPTTPAPGSPASPATRRSTACGASALAEKKEELEANAEALAPSAEEIDADEPDPARRPPAADLHLLPPGAGPRGAGGAHPAHPRRPDTPPRSPAPSSSPSRPWPSGWSAPSARSATPASPTRCPARAAAERRLGAGDAVPDLQRGLLRLRGDALIAPSSRRGDPSGAACSSRRRRDEPEEARLLALMLLQHSRRDARSTAGEMVLLEDQDRSLWDRAADRGGARARRRR